MIHYSVIPLEDIFQDYDKFTPSYVDIEQDGFMMQIEPLSGFQARIVRLYSCNPQDYLNAKYAPGTMISYRPQVETYSGL
ncbi:YlzJ-like family protein [Paenibacillus roseipurpureus]|uniref:YlzJ-like family protein n=1 Tax=Paenibacillus roseopurpureus TaxID=2918901 RepID=A0AA96LSX2_9BACL|nr:YlzJ-like family protein [Paenibacillus sp. MBLB1832]WNR46703.1 YlzJ-like family protein [Paenibacillus sp. MBLB1832]